MIRFLKYKTYILWSLVAIALIGGWELFRPSPEPVPVATAPVEKAIAETQKHIDALDVQAKHSAAVIEAAKRKTALARMHRTLQVTAPEEPARHSDFMDRVKAASETKNVEPEGANQTPVNPPIGGLGDMAVASTPEYATALEEEVAAYEEHTANLDAVIDAEKNKDRLQDVRAEGLKEENTQLRAQNAELENRIFWGKVGLVAVLVLVGAHFLIPVAL